MLGTTNQRPLEADQHPIKADRAKRFTAKNVGDWYHMVVESLVEMRHADWQEEFVSDVPLCTRAFEMIIIVKPDRVALVDKPSVELDMTKSSKEERAKIVVDKNVDRSTAAEGLAFKGGLQGSGVGGAWMESGRALPVLFVFQGHSLQPRWLSQSPGR